MSRTGSFAAGFVALRRGLGAVAVMSLALLAGCTRPGLNTPPQDLGTADLARDLGHEPNESDQGMPDLPIADLGGDDLSSLPDLANGDAPLCGGGYLNSTLPEACPLSCSPAVESVPDEGAFHVADDMSVMYHHNPPASGNHWPVPAPWGVHSDVVPREWWVHNLEHQGIVLLYNCPTDCSADVAKLIALHNAHPADQFNEIRILVTADPLLPKRFAAVAWDWTLVTDTIDMTAFQCFIDARYGRGPEPAP